MGTRPAVHFLALGAVLMVCALPAFALRVAWNVDIQQNKFNDAIGANDFHVWGVLESGDPTGANPPGFLGQVNFTEAGGPGGPPLQVPAFNNFALRIDNGVGPPPALPLNWPIIPPPPPPVPPALPLFPPPPGPPYLPPFYYFQADWTVPNGANIPFGTWTHFGLDFDETCHNIGYWLQGAWTQNGVDPGGVPIVGFDVQDQSSNPYMRLQHAVGGEELAVEIRQMQMLILPPEAGLLFPLEDLNKSFFDAHPEYLWATVPSNMLPSGPWADSFFDVFLDMVPGLGDLGGTGNVLIAREQMQDGQGNLFWEFQLHQSHVVVPEPLTMLAVLAGIGGLGGYLRRRRG